MLLEITWSSRLSRSIPDSFLSGFSPSYKMNNYYSFSFRKRLVKRKWQSCSLCPPYKVILVESKVTFKTSNSTFKKSSFETT